MGKLFYIMGKSATGKDTIYKELLLENPQLKKVVLYTTRPMRMEEKEGVEYHFISSDQLELFEKKGKIIEKRTYQTVFGPWDYATVDDGQIDLSSYDYLLIGTLESYESMCRYFGSDALVPLYIHVEDGIRLRRALEREEKQEVPKYQELCRRFLADDMDFSSNKLEEQGIGHGFSNENLKTCKQELLEEINRWVK